MCRDHSHGQGPSRLALALAVCLAASVCVAVPSVPPPTSASAMALQQTVLSAAAQQGPRSLSIAPGEYMFSNVSLIVTNATDLAIDARGVTLTFYYGFGLRFINCRNVSVRGLILDSEPPNYAQGTVTELINSTTFAADFDDVFIPPDPTAQPFSNAGGLAGAKVRFWDPSSRLVLPGVNVNFMRASTPFPPGGSQWRIVIAHPVLTSSVPIGSLVTVIPRRGFTWDALNCSAMLADNVTVFAGGNMGFHEHLGEGGNVYRRVAIVRKPGGRGLLALNADGFHSTDVGTGPTLEDSEISFTGDDFLNIHNRMLVVCKRLDPELGANGSSSLAIIDTSGGALAGVQAGAAIRFFRLLPGKVTRSNPQIGVGTVASATLSTDSALLQECRGATEAMQEPPYNARLVVNIASSPVFRVDFADPLPSGVTATRYNLANLESRSGANAIVRRNLFHDASGSGGRIIAKAMNGTYVDNVALRFGGLHVYAEQEWLEGDLGIRNVYLANNTLIDQPGGFTHVDVMDGLVNITCVNNTFVSDGAETHRPTGC